MHHTRNASADYLHTLVDMDRNDASAISEQCRRLHEAAKGAYDAWTSLSAATAGYAKDYTTPLPVNVDADRAYVAAFDLWQSIERLGVELLSEPAYSHAEPDIEREVSANMATWDVNAPTMSQFHAAYDAAPEGALVGLCLRCGRAFAEGQDYCPDCDKPQAPAVEPFHYDENKPGGVFGQLGEYLRDGLDLPAQEPEASEGTPPWGYNTVASDNPARYVTPAQETSPAGVLGKCRQCGWVGHVQLDEEHEPCSDCPECGCTSVTSATQEDVDELEYERKRRANWNAIADGMAPPYPSEY